MHVVTAFQLALRRFKPLARNNRLVVVFDDNIVQLAVIGFLFVRKIACGIGFLLNQVSAVFLVFQHAENNGV